MFLEWLEGRHSARCLADWVLNKQDCYGSCSLAGEWVGLSSPKGGVHGGGWQLPSTGSSATVPGEWESGPGETGRKFGFPKSTQHLFPHGRVRQVL